MWEKFFFLPIVVDRISETALDDRGRLALPKEIRERYGEHYHIVQLHDGIKLIPIEDDLFGALRTEFVDVEKTAEELRCGARNAALDEAGR